jgi:cbb3-type cytochrome oxidase maturation protein
MGLYYVFWTMLIAASLWVSLGAFLWAHRHGQFRDQERARFLPLRGEPAPGIPAHKGGSRREAFVVCIILVLGFAAILTAVIVAFVRTAGVTA